MVSLPVRDERRCPYAGTSDVVTPCNTDSCPYEKMVNARLRMTGDSGSACFYDGNLPDTPEIARDFRIRQFERDLQRERTKAAA